MEKRVEYQVNPQLSANLTKLFCPVLYTEMHELLFQDSFIYQPAAQTVPLQIAWLSSASLPADR